jgi:hypothetical protein
MGEVPCMLQAVEVSTVSVLEHILLQELLSVTVTEYVPEVLTEIDDVIAPVLHT